MSLSLSPSVRVAACLYIAPGRKGREKGRVEQERSEGRRKKPSVENTCFRRYFLRLFFVRQESYKTRTSVRTLPSPVP